MNIEEKMKRIDDLARRVVGRCKLDILDIDDSVTTFSGTMMQGKNDYRFKIKVPANFFELTPSQINDHARALKAKIEDVVKRVVLASEYFHERKFMKYLKQQLRNYQDPEWVKRETDRLIGRFKKRIEEITGKLKNFETEMEPFTSINYASDFSLEEEFFDRLAAIEKKKRDGMDGEDDE